MRKGPSWFLLVWLGAFAWTAVRLIHIEADTPSWLWSGSMAEYVDEGYKTLGPRNLALFGTTHWNKADTYPTWMGRSPITQWPYFFSFRLIGARLASARLVTILFYLLFLATFVIRFKAKYKAPLLLVGLAVLGLSHIVFFFSRLAIFEIPILTLLYCSLFFLESDQPFITTKRILLVLSFLTAATLGIKATALIYATPVVVGLVFHKRPAAAGVGALKRAAIPCAAVLAFVLYLTRIHWLHMPDIDFGFFHSLLVTPLTLFAGFIVTSGLFCTFHLIVCKPDSLTKNAYRLCLVMIIALGPILLALAPINPTRYYIPILPAYLLLTLEWLYLRAWKIPIPDKIPLFRSGLAVTMLFWTLASLGKVVDQAIEATTGLSGWLFPIAQEATGLPKFILGLALTLLLTVLAWSTSRRLFQGRSSLVTVVVLLTLAGLQDSAAVGRFLASPSYESRRISADLERMVVAGESMAGDWAPFFALGTEIGALYVTTTFNPPSQVASLRPDYFLFCDSPSGDGREVLQLLKASHDVQVGPPAYKSHYLGFEVVLYRLTYEQPADGPSPSSA